MDITTPQSEGSTGINDPQLELTAVCLPGDVAATSHWACGMPLSFVQETADLWLTQHGHRDQGFHGEVFGDVAVTFEDPPK